MKRKTNDSRRRTLLFSLLAIMLVFSTVMPSSAIAADERVITVDSTTKYTTVHDLNTDTFELTLKIVGGKKWASDAIDKEKLLIDGIQATQEKTKWNEYKGNDAIKIKRKDTSSDIYTNADRSELTLVFARDTSYDLAINQSITINMNSALIEEWPGEVTPINFIIYANPQIVLGGSITKDTTLEDLEKGGKEIELQLLNAKWNEEYITKITNFNKLLDGFKNSEITSGIWDVAKALKNTDPNKVISYSEDKRTLRIKLPAITSTNFGEMKVTVPEEFYTIEKINSDGVLSDSGSKIPGDKIAQTSSTIVIGNYEIPGMQPMADLEEINLRKIYTSAESKPALTLKLKSAKWNLSTSEKKMLLFDSIKAKDQKDQWELIKKELSTGSVTEVDESTIKITFPENIDLHLIKDMALTLNIPYQLLVNDVKIPEQRFNIKAQPKVLLSGTATPVISLTDFVKGGKTFILTLVNAEWQSDVATNTKKREDLLKSFKWNNALQNEILAKADVKRTNSSTVTIHLPAVSQKFIGEINFQSKDLTSKGLLENDLDFLGKISTLDVKAVHGQSAVITGTAATNLNEWDIVKGEKTIVISLENDTWKSTLEELTESSPIQLVTDGGKRIEYNLTRTNDTTATLKLKANRSFSLTEDQNVKIIIPEALFSVRTSGALEIASAFKVSAVTASLSGTGMLLDPADVQRGNKTLIITLNNAEFKDNMSAADVRGMFRGTGLPWSFTLSNFTVAKNKLTIKLPAVPTYPLISAQSFELAFTNNLLKDYSDMPSVVKNVEDGKVSIGEIASANLDRTSIAESDIQTGGRSLTITLSNAEWDDALTTNTSKKSALLRGFAVTDQTKEWGIASTIIAKEGDFSISGKKLTIKLPGISNYSIIRDQNIGVTIPKTVLKNYKYDIEVDKNLLITVPTIRSETPFSEILESGLVTYIDENELSNIRVEVPKKVIQKISTYVAKLEDGKVFTTIEVETDGFATKAVATVLSGGVEESKELSTKVNNNFTFVFANVEENSKFKIEVYDDSGNVLESSYNILAKGNKVFTNVPKNPIDGSYTLHSLLTDKTLLANILKYYFLKDLKIGILD